MLKPVIIEYLEALNLKWVDSGVGYLLTQCPNPEHKDTQPSALCSTNEGWISCKSCGYYVSPKTFISENEELQDLVLSSRFNDIIDKLNAKFLAVEVPRVFTLPPYNEETGAYRGLSADFMKEIKAYKCNIGRFQERIIFPFSDISDNLVGYTGRYTGSSIDKKIPKYLHSTGIRPSDTILFSNLIQTLKIDATTLIVVEGSHDAYHLIQKGIAATPSLGFRVPTDKWVLNAIALGVEHVVLAWDNDNVGMEKMIGKTSLFPQWQSKLDCTLGLFHPKTKFLYSSKFKDFGEFYEWLGSKQINKLKDII